MSQSIHSGTHEKIVLFDGVCNLCNGVVQFVIKRNKHATLRFAALQSETGQAFLKQFNLPTDSFESFVFISGNTYFTKSTAALQLTRHLDGSWRLLYGLIIFPRFLRDWVYSLVAKSRYKVFGRTDSCMVPTPELRSRFLV